MKIGIMQPYFLPYIGYISLIKNTDRFILLDEVQFIRHGWIERNRILKPVDGWQYIQVPLNKMPQKTIIKDITVNNQTNWREKIISQLGHYKKIAPYYYSTVKLLNNIFSRECDSITALNRNSLETICEYLGFERPIEIFSETGLKICPAQAADEWALNICKAIPGVTEYWNPPGGMEFFDKSKYDDAGISLKFHSVNINPYGQKRELFEAGLSIIDVMMFNSVDEINDMLDDFTLTA